MLSASIRGERKAVFRDDTFSVKAGVCSAQSFKRVCVHVVTVIAYRYIADASIARVFDRFSVVGGQERPQVLFGVRLWKFSAANWACAWSVRESGCRLFLALTHDLT